MANIVSISRCLRAHEAVIAVSYLEQFLGAEAMRSPPAVDPGTPNRSERRLLGPAKIASRRPQHLRAWWLTVNAHVKGTSIYYRDILLAHDFSISTPPS